MKKTSLIMAFIAPLTMGVSVNAFAKDSLLEWKSDDGTDSLKLGGVVRLNQRYEDWEGPNRGFGKLYFDIFRVDLKGKFDDAYFNASYLFKINRKRPLKKHMWAIT
jgi:hypothetical protein